MTELKFRQPDTRTAPFTRVPTRYEVEQAEPVRELFGVEIPEHIPFYDVRMTDDDMFPLGVSEWGGSLMSGDYALLKHGLKQRWGTVPMREHRLVDCHFYFDSRKPGLAPESAKQVKGAVEAFEKHLEKFDEAVLAIARLEKMYPGWDAQAHGGLRVSPPVLVTFDNYGWGVVGDMSKGVVLPAYTPDDKWVSDVLGR